MHNTFTPCLKAEWLKKRHSFSSWLVIIGGSFTPLIYMLVFFIYPKQLADLHQSPGFWKMLFLRSWETMSLLLLPMGIVLAVSLITQLEFKNNTWKQLHTAPVSFSSIYFSKLMVILVMMLQLFILFNFTTYLSAVIPSMLSKKVPFPLYEMNVFYFLKENSIFFITCLPMVAFQYLISLQFKNFLVPIGAGLALVTAGLIAHSWKYIYMIPSTYTGLHFMEAATNKPSGHNIIALSLGYFLFFVVLGYVLYIAKKEKG
ncbi:ABC transporter permease [Ferruginibacter sp. HRS2-29]|uniref:ABC transporter permease n=1 Tax=Ferruginibacter sp. HRS2-29 TaxID=2487334 RepID=UPI0020CE9E2F|nr:ABC transporter permease [Ferruginibacter sp. HRS2-29]MCP9750713.1 hypothetical protein [Ferruginibacter sp. HRS2-29]